MLPRVDRFFCLWLIRERRHRSPAQTFTNSQSSGLGWLAVAALLHPSTYAAAAEVLVHSCLEFAAKRSELAAVTIKV